MEKTLILQRYFYKKKRIKKTTGSESGLKKVTPLTSTVNLNLDSFQSLLKSYTGKICFMSLANGQ